MQPPPAPAFAYLRVSGKGQLDGDGFDRQREAIDRYARAQGLTVAETFAEEGVSGTLEAPDRPALSEMLGRLLSGGPRVVLIEKADRLARDLIVQELLLAEFRKAGARVVAVDSGVDMTEGDEGEPTKKLIRQILGAVAEFDKSTIVLKLRAARQRIRARRGRCEGRKPFGSRPGEVETLEHVRRLAGKGAPPAEIAAALNAEGRATRTGRPWARGTVWAILNRLRDGPGPAREVGP